MKFIEWIRKEINDFTPIGVLAAVVIIDIGFVIGVVIILAAIITVNLFATIGQGIIS